MRRSKQSYIGQMSGTIFGTRAKRIRMIFSRLEHVISINIEANSINLWTSMGFYPITELILFSRVVPEQNPKSISCRPRFEPPPNKHQRSIWQCLLLLLDPYFLFDKNIQSPPRLDYLTSRPYLGVDQFEFGASIDLRGNEGLPIIPVPQTVRKHREKESRILYGIRAEFPW